MLPKLALPAVIGVFLLTTTTTLKLTAAAAQTTTTTKALAKQTAAASEAATTTTLSATAAVSELVHSAETTTSLLPLQPPPLNVTSTTTSSFPFSSLSGAAVQPPATGQHSIGKHVAVKSDNTKKKPNENEADLSPSESQLTAEVAQALSTGNQPQHTPDSSGYLHFDLTNEEEDKAAQAQETISTESKAETVNEVLSNLFPNGFTDIFRFSYASEPGNTSPTSTTTTPSPTPTVALSSSSTEQALPSQSTYYSYETSVSKEYRREVSPGHTEIVVEKLALLPRSSSEEFNDGSNLISKDALLRINRAAVDAPVLPSLLVEPTQGNRTREAKSSAMNAPIIILNDDTADMEESNGEEDNLIAESQNVASQHVYQMLPETDKSYAFKDDGRYKVMGPQLPLEQQISVQILQDDNLSNVQGQTIAEAAPQDAPVTQQLDRFQEHVEQSFQQRNSVQEAPSRKFLKNFNPTLSESANTPVQKGNFHYELNTPQSVYQNRPQAEAAQSYGGNYGEEAVRPAAQLQYLREQQQQQQLQSQEAHSTSALHTQIRDSQPISSSAYEQANAAPPFPTDAPQHLVFVTVNTPARETSAPPSPSLPPAHSSKSPHEYVSEAAAAASQLRAQHASAPTAKPRGGYTYVEVQKSVNIHNKLITEKDGKLVEQHETIYPQPQYGQRLPAQAPRYEQHQQSQLQQQHGFSGKDYVSLSTNPINVQHIDQDGEYQEEAASHANVQHVAPPEAHASEHSAPPAAAPVPLHYAPSQQYAGEGAPVYTHYPYSLVQVVEKHVPEPYPVKETVEKIVDRPVPVEKVVDRPVDVPYPVPVEHYIDRPYPVHEIVEKHVPVPYPVPEPVAVPIHFDRYIDRPYPVETIVEKPVPYPVETVVEKVVEKHVPVEVERIVEKPVEKLVEKYVDRPIAIPIHVPVAVPVPMSGHHSHGIQLHSEAYGAPFHAHPNALGWEHSALSTQIPSKVLQNYYTRMLKKLIPQRISYKTPTPAAATTRGHTKAPTRAAAKPPTTGSVSKQSPKPTYKITDMRFDLKPPPPPALGPSWAKGARYIYNTLPHDLAASAASAPAQFGSYYGVTGSANSEQQDEFQRWRNGHSLKRSPQFGRNLQMEYGFKPPLVPSVEIDDQGIPLSAAITDSERTQK